MASIDFDIRVTTIKDTPVTLGDDGQGATLGDLCMLMLAQADLPPTGDNNARAMRRYRIGRKLEKGGSAVLASEEVTLLKDCAGAFFAKQPFIYGAIVDLLDPPAAE